MTGRAEKLRLAAVAAAMEYLDLESRTLASARKRRPMSRWKSTRWRAMRDRNYPTANLWKHVSWL